MTFSKGVQALACDELLCDLTFELNALTAVLCHGFHSANRQAWSIPQSDLSTLRGALQLKPIPSSAEKHCSGAISVRRASASIGYLEKNQLEDILTVYLYAHIKFLFY